MNFNRDDLALTPLAGIKSFKYGTWDCEASDWWNLQVIGCFDGEKYYWFKTVDGFLDHIMQKKYESWRWFAHFGGRYDMNFIFDRLRERGNAKVSFYCSGSMVMRMTIKHGRLSTHLCDSFRLLPASLRELTKSFNVAHQKMDFDFETLHFGMKLLEYNEQDCKGLYEVLDSFFEQTGIRSETFATHALRYWRKEFLQRKIYKPHDRVTDFIRPSYHGGRVEVFKRQSPHLYVYDVNSMYPSVMQQAVPTDYIGESRTITGKYYGFVQAIVTVPADYIPILPIRMEKLFFPCGTIRGTWTTEELQVAEQHGAKIQKIIKAVYFGVDKIFQGYVDKLYALKKTAGEPARTIAKYLLNSLYGKFGQHPDKKVFCTEREAPHGSYPILVPTGEPSGFAYYTRHSHSAYLLPHLASAITSKARLVLLPRLGQSTYYCDTDSVFSSEQQETGNELGAWSLVGEGEAFFVQPKLYKVKGVWKAKGLNREQSIDAFVDGDVNTYLRRRSIKEALRDGKPACQDVMTEKFLRQTRPKRAWVGEDTRPWDMKELEKEQKK